MDIDPHTLQQIIQRIHQQTRCPQCGKRVHVDFSSVRLVAADALLLQMKCEMCNAYIVLHASLQGVEQLSTKDEETYALSNASSALHSGQNEARELREALKEANGSFGALFKESEEDKNTTEIA